MTPRTLWILPVVGADGVAEFRLPRVLDFPEKTVCAFVDRWMVKDAQLRVVSSPFLFPFPGQQREKEIA